MRNKTGPDDIANQGCKVGGNGVHLICKIGMEAAAVFGQRDYSGCEALDIDKINLGDVGA